MRKHFITVQDTMQQGYRYELTAPTGKQFADELQPELTPGEMLRLGVFDEKYMTDCKKEFPALWFRKAKRSPRHHDPTINYLGVDASRPLSEWRKNDWIHPDDPRAWFQWYCRYYLGRRLIREDARQIKRWKMICRHLAQIKKHCQKGNLNCHKRQRQALLHWAYDSRKI